MKKILILKKLMINVINFNSFYYYVNIMSEEENNSNRIFCIITVARQIGGEYIFIRTERAFKKASKADEFLSKLKSTLVDSEGKPLAVELSTPNGSAKCYREAGCFEIELEE